MAQAYDTEQLTAAKAAVTERLAGTSLAGLRLRAVDPRLEQYVRQVMKHPRRHNLWEQLAVERFVGMCRKYGLDAHYVRAFYAFYEFLTFPGSAGPTRYKLTPVQCFQFASVFGFWEGDRRVVREAVLFVPRKFSKTTSSAAFAVWDLIMGDSNAESYTGANSADQARKCFDVIRSCILHLDPHERLFRVNKQIIRALGRRSALAQCLTANARTKDGLSASTIIMDEFSQAREATLYNVLTTSMGVRKNPLTVIITTASEVFDGPFYDMLNGYKRVLMGDLEDDSIFAHLFEPDVGDKEDDPATWRKVQPHWGITVRPEYYEQEYMRAQRSGAAGMLAFRTKMLNQYAAPDWQRWLTRGDIARASVDFRQEDVYGTPWVVSFGVDMSEVDDFSAVTAAYYNTYTAEYLIDTRYFLPASAIAGHPNEELYRKWAADGWLTLTDGPVVDYRALTDYIIDVGQYTHPIAVGYDSRSATDFANYLGAIGMQDITFPISQNYGNFTGPMVLLERMIKEGPARVARNPITLYCYGNIVVGSSSDGRKPEKKTQNQKIDGVISTLMAVRKFLYYDPTKD